MSDSKSIKNKLLTAIILINSIIFVGILVFKFGFEDFYIKNTGKELNKLANEIEILVSEGDEENLIDYVIKNAESKNISVEIYDENDSLIFTNEYETIGKYNKNPNKQNSFMLKKNKCHIQNEHKIGEKLSTYITLDKSKGIESLSAIVKSKDRLYSIVCKTPIVAIQNSVDKAFKFLLMIFIPVIIVSIFIAIYFSNIFTKPIIKLTKISNKISNLDFSEKANINTNDEIEILASSINELSYKIENTMNDLNTKNKELKLMINQKVKEEKLKREFVSSVSHELKTPITVINGYAQGLKSNILDNEEDRNFYIDVICEESEKMGVMVNDLLDLYKLESKTFKIRPQKVDIGNLINHVIKKQELILKQKDIYIEIDISKEYVLADALRIEQVLNNLLDNAINHAKNEKLIKIYTKSENDSVYIGVYNSGEKINESDIEKIWHSFVRIDKARTSTNNRVGLGLAIVREIINLHNGEYGALNKERGVEFWIKLKKF